MTTTNPTNKTQLDTHSHAGSTPPATGEASHHLQLIRGTFSAGEAERILSELISSKINYHNLEALRILERSSGDYRPHEKRAGELREAREAVLNFLQQARETGATLEIKSTVEIRILP